MRALYEFTKALFVSIKTYTEIYNVLKPEIYFGLFSFYLDTFEILVKIQNILI